VLLVVIVCWFRVSRQRGAAEADAAEREVREQAASGVEKGHCLRLFVRREYLTDNLTDDLAVCSLSL
jgi:hypothetical protein